MLFWALEKEFVHFEKKEVCPALPYCFGLTTPRTLLPIMVPDPKNLPKWYDKSHPYFFEK